MPRPVHTLENRIPQEGLEEYLTGFCTLLLKLVNAHIYPAKESTTLAESYVWTGSR